MGSSTECARNGHKTTEKSDKVYHLVGNRQKGPIRERVPKQRLPNVFFAHRLHEAALDGVHLLRLRRCNTSGSRDLVSPATTYKWTCNWSSRMFKCPSEAQN